MNGAWRSAEAERDRDPSAAGSAGWLLPPGPGFRAWPLAGACAGALLGAAEVLLAFLSGMPLPAGLGSLLALGAGLVGAVLGSAVGLALQATRVRVSHSALVGASVGLLLALDLPGDLVAATRAGAVGVRALGASLASVALALVAGVLGARLGDRLERGGLPLRPLVVLAPAAMLYAVGEAMGAPGASLRGLGGAVLVTAGLASLATALAARGVRRTSTPRPWSQQLLASTLVAAAATALPHALPWILADPAPLAARDGSGPVSVLVVDLGGVEDPAALPALALFAAEAVRFEILGDADGAAEGVLAGVSSTLGERGWISAAVVLDPARAAAAALDEIDASPGPGGALARVADRTVAGPLLLAVAPALPRMLGLDRVERSPQERSAAARAWLFDWRTRRSHAPFLVLVELAERASAGAAAAPVAGASVLDVAFEQLLAALTRLDLEATTLVLVTARRGDGGIEALARLPGAAQDAPRGVRVATPIPAAILAAVLRALPDATAASPPTLPGVASEGPPAASRAPSEPRPA